jgi:hypothetical protein
MNNSINLYKDVLIGVFYLSGVAGLMSGEILFSAALIGTASLISNFHFR